nr:MAG TPA: hypothetical protein [Caudoviricetes sp.]
MPHYIGQNEYLKQHYNNYIFDYIIKIIIQF